MILAAKLALGAVGSMVLAGVWVARDGVIRVAVDEERPGREPTHFHLVVPAALVTPALHLVPQEHLRASLKEAREWMPAAQVLCEELAKLPDTELVEVRDARDHVRVRTQDGLLIVDVDNRDEHVHVAFPLRAAWKLAREIQELAPES